MDLSGVHRSIGELEFSASVCMVIGGNFLILKKKQLSFLVSFLGGLLYFSQRGVDY